jgi:hypothetical protein
VIFIYSASLQQANVRSLTILTPVCRRGFFLTTQPFYPNRSEWSRLLLGFRFQGFFIPLVHALTDTGHHRGGQIKGCIQDRFGYPLFPGVRQASIDSRLAVSNDGDGNADEGLLTLREQVGGVGIVVILAKSFFLHDGPPE